ncbi:MAG: Flp pilus assembly complex ATPase component TadA [Thermoleophilia bacterium]|nr:Flp pilus assembly complex ATPase component TadA [Thermoleophilia bacterium]
MEAAAALGRERLRLGELLVREGLLTQAQLDQVLTEKRGTRQRLGELVVAHGWVTEVQIAQALAEQYQLEFVNLDASPPNPAAATLLPEKFARRYRAVPIRFAGDRVVVAVADPTNVLASDDLRIALGLELQLTVATASGIDAALERLHPAGERDDVEVEVDAGDGAAPRTVRRLDVMDVRESADSGPAVTLVNEVIKRAIEEGASDVHLEPQLDRLVVRARIDGVMRPVRTISTDLMPAVTTRIKIMAELDIAERRMPQDGRVSIRFGGEPMDIRVAVLPTMHGEQVVLRILYRTSRSLDFSRLGLSDETTQTLTNAIQQPYGCVISCGPTGSGKTTTLYAALDMLNDPGRVVMTIEDPVEFQLEGVNQIQVNPRAGLTFGQGLRTILRSDPDVLLVGEIRDDETAKIAVQAAMTGHLVLTTLHADNVASSVSRLKNMGVDPSLLASTVNCIFAQRLVRKLCVACMEPYQATRDDLRIMGLDDTGLPERIDVHRARGCALCSDGYKGRLGMFETLRVTPAMRFLIERSTAEELYAAAVESGMHTLQQDGLRLALAGQTSLEEVRRVAGERRV